MSEDTDLKTRDETKSNLKEPPMYGVWLHNDDYTPMDFVVDILRAVFHKSAEEAVRIMLQVHREGAGICGVYTAEIAESKVDRVQGLSRRAGHPLRCTMESE